MKFNFSLGLPHVLVLNLLPIFVWFNPCITPGYAVATTEAGITAPLPESPEPAESHYDKCDLPMLGGEEPQPVPENLIRMGPNSKYFILSGEDDVPIKEVGGLCQSVGLQPAEIRNNVELMAISAFLKEIAPEKVQFSLGINDEKEEGRFVEFDGTPMSFHSFAELQPDNRENIESCVMVSLNPIISHFVYDDVNCNHSVTPMCMFKPTDECFLADPQTLAKVKEDFEMIMSSSVRDYYVKMKQYTWEDAASVCAKAGYKLVDFNTSLDNNQMLYDAIRKWLAKNFIIPRVAFWTGGKIVRKDIGQSKGKPGETVKPVYKFEGSGKLLKDLSEWPSLVWDTDEPSDGSRWELEDCISTVLYHPYKATNDNLFSMATTNCRLPHYPICFQEKTLVAANATVDVSTTAAPLEGRIDRDGTAGRFCNLGEIKVDLTKAQLDTPELLKLAAVSRHENYGSPDYRFKWAETVDKKWLTELVEQIYRIPKTVCPDEFVPPEYINIMHNLLILYYNGVADGIKDPSAVEQKYLEEDAAILFQCGNVVQPLKLESAGGLPVKFGEYSVTPILETVDYYFRNDNKALLIVDRVIDVFWYLYVVTVGACYPYELTSKTYSVEERHNLFTNYFLEVFQDRWFGGMKQVDYGILMGDLDEEAAYQSLRSCAIAAFHRSNITELYLPRPVFLDRDEKIMVNQKIQTL